MSYIDLIYFCVCNARLTEESLKKGMSVEVSKAGGKIQLPHNFCPSATLGLTSCNSTFSITAIDWLSNTHVSQLTE